MTDRELTELAAKAAGINLKWSRDDDLAPRIADTWEIWNPLKDDGDALRLAVKLRLVLLLELPRISIGPRMDFPEIYLEEDEDEMSATRRAIVRAAAEIGKHSTIREENLALVAKLHAEKAKP